MLYDIRLPQKYQQKNKNTNRKGAKMNAHCLQHPYFKAVTQKFILILLSVIFLLNAGCAAKKAVVKAEPPKEDKILRIIHELKSLNFYGNLASVWLGFDETANEYIGSIFHDGILFEDIRFSTSIKASESSIRCFLVCVDNIIICNTYSCELTIDEMILAVHPAHKPYIGKVRVETRQETKEAEKLQEEVLNIAISFYSEKLATQDAIVRLHAAKSGIPASNAHYILYIFDKTGTSIPFNPRRKIQEAPAIT